MADKEIHSLDPGIYSPVARIPQQRQVDGLWKDEYITPDNFPQPSPGGGGGGLTPIYVTETDTSDITAQDGKLYICSNSTQVRIFAPATEIYTQPLRFAVSSITADPNAQIFSVRSPNDAQIYILTSQLNSSDRGIVNLQGVNGYSYCEFIKVSANLWYATIAINVNVQLDAGQGAN